MYSKSKDDTYYVHKVYTKIGPAKTLITNINRAKFSKYKDCKWTECEVDFDKSQHELDLALHLTKRALERS